LLPERGYSVNKLIKGMLVFDIQYLILIFSF
jgi:hypothetical protein